LIDDHPFLVYEPKKCVLCGRCVRVCGQLDKGYKLDFAHRGMDTIISFFGSDLDPASQDCESCLACTEVCPVGALSGKKQWRSFILEIEAKEKKRSG